MSNSSFAHHPSHDGSSPPRGSRPADHAPPSPEAQPRRPVSFPAPARPSQGEPQADGVP